VATCTNVWATATSGYAISFGNNSRARKGKQTIKAKSNDNSLRLSLNSAGVFGIVADGPTVAIP
jgi:hypothetical protein